jgi:hypothetical protein
MLKWTLYRMTVDSDDPSVYFGRSRDIVIPSRFECQVSYAPTKQGGFRPIHPLRFRPSGGISRPAGGFVTG